jgi:hypothetical protein
MTRIVTGLVTIANPDLAAQLADQAEDIAQAITRQNLKASALTSVAVTISAAGPDRAERIAQAITRQDLKASALISVAEAIPVAPTYGETK